MGRAVERQGGGIYKGQAKRLTHPHPPHFLEAFKQTVFYPQEEVPLLAKARLSS